MYYGPISLLTFHQVAGLSSFVVFEAWAGTARYPVHPLLTPCKSASRFACDSAALFLHPFILPQLDITPPFEISSNSSRYISRALPSHRGSYSDLHTT